MMRNNETFQVNFIVTRHPERSEVLGAQHRVATKASACRGIYDGVLCDFLNTKKCLINYVLRLHFN